MRALIIPVTLLALGATTAQAGKGTELGKALGSPTVGDDLERNELGKKWASAKGDWKLVNGAIVGKELKTDKHAAVLSFQHPNQNSAIQFSFKLEGADFFHLSYNKKRGHLFRVLVTPEQIAVNLDKDKRDPKSKPKRLAVKKAAFAQGEWYTMLVVVEGENVSITTDNGVKMTLTHPDIDQQKPNYRFILKGESLLLDDVKSWDLK